MESSVIIKGLTELYFFWGLDFLSSCVLKEITQAQPCWWTQNGQMLQTMLRALHDFCFWCGANAYDQIAWCPSGPACLSLSAWPSGVIQSTPCRPGQTGVGFSSTTVAHRATSLITDRKPTTWEGHWEKRHFCVWMSPVFSPQPMPPQWLKTQCPLPSPAALTIFSFFLFWCHRLFPFKCTLAHTTWKLIETKCHNYAL